MTDQDRINELERENEALKAQLSDNDTQPDSLAVPLWKKIIGGGLSLLLCVGVYYCYKGQAIEVLTILNIFIFGVGVILVFFFLFSKETFLWLIGKKTEYHNILKAGQSLTTGAVGTALKYAPIDLNNQEKENIKRDVPALVEMGLMTGINNYIIRFFIGTFAASFALLGTIVLMNQNEKIDKQNIRLEQQTYLQEAERRSSLVFLFSNIMDAVDKELKEDIGKKGVRDLSPQLIGRITGLSTRLKPYRYLDGDELTTKPLSPERGQLFISLLGSQLDTNTLVKIYNRIDLRDADLIGANLRGANLIGADLSDADLAFADLSDANLRDADLRDADLSRADLGDANLSGADLTLTDLSRADLSDADLRYAYLLGAYLIGANLRGANLWNADLSIADLSQAKVDNDFLRETQLKGYQIDSTFEYNEWTYHLVKKK